jgi:hypothetical protein
MAMTSFLPIDELKARVSQDELTDCNIRFKIRSLSGVEKGGQAPAESRFRKGSQPATEPVPVSQQPVWSMPTLNATIVSSKRIIGLAG